jgi:aspartyl-tRNA(Asn)/glutamyl-tRNA(Gln) amidotransferase subunit A
MAVVSYSVTDHAGLSIAEAARLIANRELSPVELVGSCLDRAAAIEHSIRAFVTLDSRGALEQARAAAEREPVGPLHGIPIAIKDLIDVAGLPTTASSRVLKDAGPALVDAPVVARLRTAGAVIVGKTNTQEFAYGVVSAPTRNPWDTDRIPGGSSGGSAAALASGMCLGALGTDTAGSVRIPAALCGVTGLKTAPGSLPVDGIIPLSPSLDVCGPMARSAVDCDLMWSALTGDATGHPAPADALRVGAPASPSEIGELDDDVDEAVRSMLECLHTAGAHRITVDLPHLKEWDRPRSLPLMTEALLVHREAGWYPERAELYEADTRAAFEYAAKLSAADLVDAYKTLEGLTARLLSVFDDVDVLILATTPVPAPSVEEAGGRDGEYRPPVTRSLTRICGPVNWCRLAAVSVPCGFTSNGLPIGAQIIGRDERTVINVALLYQRVTDWHERRPPIPGRT